MPCRVLVDREEFSLQMRATNVAELIEQGPPDRVQRFATTYVPPFPVHVWVRLGSIAAVFEAPDGGS